MSTTRAPRKPVARATKARANKPTTAPTATAQQPILAPLVAKDFTSTDVKFLSENENFRYLPPSKKVGHAVIIADGKAGETALQFAIPQDATDDKTPQFRPLLDIEAIQRYGLRRYKAKTPAGTVMYATRFLEAELGKENPTPLKIACFSPKPANKPEPFWGGGKATPLFRNDLTAEEQADLDAELKDVKPTSKGGNVLAVDHDSVRLRDLNKTRNPDQNTVMGESAKDAYETFMNSMTDDLSAEMKDRLKRAVEAPLKGLFYSQYRPEWLHAEGFSLTPMSKNPQVKENLGAAGKWANTEMMVLERIAKWFAINRPESLVTIKPFFEMLLDSDLIKSINFQITVEEKGKFIRFLQTLDPFNQYPLFRKPTDLTQGTAVAFSLLNGIKPVSEQAVVDNSVLHAAGTTMAAAPTSADLAVAASAPIIPVPTVAMAAPTIAFTAPMPQKPSIVVAAREAPQPSVLATTAAPLAAALPTHLLHQNSIVQTATTSQEHDYDEPWRGASIVNSHGTGAVIAHGGRKYVLTNAHCVENASFVDVRLANHRKKFTARPICVSYQCDLALLEVNHPKFQALAVPVELGDMIHLQQEIQTMGFPMGGEEISVSRGIVSRIEVRDYCMSNEDMLQVQIDAAVNPGNSGGPVFSADKVVGIAFQGYGLQGLSFMIPIPIIKHFLADALSGQPYKGFPILPIETQPLENSSLRKSFGMQPKQTGVRVKRIGTLSDAHDKLKPDDILLAIDGLPIANDGTVSIPGIGDCIDLIHVTHMKHIGDTVKMKVLRQNPDGAPPSILDIDVRMDNTPHSAEIVPFTEHDKSPTYFIASGLVFQPLTRNYLESNGSDLEEHYVEEAGCYLHEVPKKSPDEQCVVLTNVLDCTLTRGYDNYTNAIVKEVNGKPIHNFREFMEAMENNKEHTHTILVAGKDRIVIRNLSPQENREILRKYKIQSDRSDDLKQSPACTATAMEIDESDSDDAPTQEAAQKNHRGDHNVAPNPPSADAHDNDTEATESMSDGNESDDESDSQAMEASDEEDNTADAHDDDAHAITADMLPGLRRYQGKLMNMEERYKALTDMENRYEEKYGALPKDSSDDEDFEDEDTSDEQPAKPHHAQAHSRHRLFQPAPASPLIFITNAESSSLTPQRMNPLRTRGKK